MTRDHEQRQFCASLHRLNWEMHKHAMEMLERIHLTKPQRIVLGILNELGGRGTMCDLIERSLQSGPTLTRIVDRLVAAGLVTRERDDDDRRLVYIALTDAGCAKEAEATALGENDIRQLTDDLSVEELEQLNHLMHRLLNGMETMRHTAHQTS